MNADGRARDRRDADVTTASTTAALAPSSSIATAAAMTTAVASGSSTSWSSLFPLPVGTRMSPSISSSPSTARRHPADEFMTSSRPRPTPPPPAAFLQHESASQFLSYSALVARMRERAGSSSPFAHPSSSASTLFPYRQLPQQQQQQQQGDRRQLAAFSVSSAAAAAAATSFTSQLPSHNLAPYVLSSADVMPYQTAAAAAAAAAALSYGVLPYRLPLPSGAYRTATWHGAADISGFLQPAPPQLPQPFSVHSAAEHYVTAGTSAVTSQSSARPVSTRSPVELPTRHHDRHRSRPEPGQVTEGHGDRYGQRPRPSTAELGGVTGRSLPRRERLSERVARTSASAAETGSASTSPYARRSPRRPPSTLTVPPHQLSLATAAGLSLGAAAVAAAEGGGDLLGLPPHHPPHFTRGSIIELCDGRLKRVEELVTEDFVRCADSSPDLRLDAITVVHMRQNHERNLVQLGFSVGSGQLQVTVEATLEHPFFVFGQGWSAFSPERTVARYGLPCHQLSVGNCCISLTRRSTSAQSTSSTTAAATTDVRRQPTSSRLVEDDPSSVPLDFSRLSRTSTETTSTSANRDFRTHAPPAVVTVSGLSSPWQPPPNGDDVSRRLRRRWSAPVAFDPAVVSAAIASSTRDLPPGSQRHHVSASAAIIELEMEEEEGESVEGGRRVASETGVSRGGNGSSAS